MMIKDGTSLIDARKAIIDAMENEKNATDSKIASTLEQKNVKEDEKREAAKHGDLSENAEYHSAIDELLKINEQLNKLYVIQEAFKSNDYIALTEHVDRSYIDIGSVVRIRHHTGREFIWMLVPSELSRIEHNTLSSKSPVGSHLIGLTKGDKVSVSIKGSTMRYTIEEVY